MSPSHSSRAIKRCAQRPLLISLFAAAAAALAGCYIVPIDPRTGEPYPNALPPRSAEVVPAIVVPQPPPPTMIGVRLYPLNERAAKAGLLQATVVDDNAGRGRFSVVYAGDLLQGESTRVDAGYASFGRVLDEVLGRPQGAPRPTAGRRGIANAYGPRGVSAQCEFIMTGPSLGTGACLLSDGAKYQMHFGG